MSGDTSELHGFSVSTTWFPITLYTVLQIVMFITVEDQEAGAETEETKWTNDKNRQTKEAQSAYRDN